MGYHFKFSGKNAFDIVVVTNNGSKLGGIPRGVIIPVEYMMARKINDLVLDLCEENGAHMYTAKHCDNEWEITHIVPYGAVNRFGVYITKDTTLDPDGDWCLDICGGMGWLVRKTIDKIEDIVKYL